MTTPDRIRPRGLTAAKRKSLTVRTASGHLVVPQAGERVELDDGHRLVDLTFALDTTGSMSDKIQGLQDCMVDFVGELGSMRLKWRFTLVPFGDLTIPGDRVDGKLSFVTDVGDAVTMIRKAPRFSGGSNNGESSLEAMRAAIMKPYRPSAVKVIVLMTDEPPLTSAQLTTNTVNAELRRGEFICFVASPAGHGFENLARNNGGKWYPIGSSLNTADLMQFLRQMLKHVTQVSSEVHRLGAGSVACYLASPQRKALE